MAEIYYAFIKDSRVVNSAVFVSENEELANRIVQEQQYDYFVLCGNTPPYKYSFYDGEKFTPPTHEYLISIGISKEMPEQNIE
jgi:hypothetical protein